MMRQAGRYLPDYMVLKEKYSFFERVQNADLAAEITVMPVNQIGVDAAILFSDILIIPQALGIDVEMIAGKGPGIHNPIRDERSARAIQVTDIEEKLGYTYGAIAATKEALNDAVPLIGFAGSPWTLLCYMVEGGGSKDFSKTKSFCYNHPDLADHVLTVLTESIIRFLKGKVQAGVDAVQLFDSWGGLLSPQSYNQFSYPYLKKIIDELAEISPVIMYPKGCWFALESWRETKASAVGIDWTISPDFAREKLAGLTVQGNLDPSILTGPAENVRKRTREMIEGFGTSRYIANLGHGILPNVPVENALAFVNTVKEYSAND
jgi:uroporphyrinogen decarboxylase